MLEFSGKKDNWPFWSMKFLSKAGKEDCRELIEGEVKIPLKTNYCRCQLISTPQKSHNPTIDRYEASVKAYNGLILLIQYQTGERKVAFQLVVGCQTGDHPQGNVVLAWE